MNYILLLIFLFCFASIYFLSLGASFISMTFLLIYLGAIVILFLFILMMFPSPKSESSYFSTPWASLFFFLGPPFLLFFYDSSSLFSYDLFPFSSSLLSSLALPLYSSYSILLFFLSILLILSILSPILLLLN